MKFSFEDPHLWKQHALALLSIGNYQHSLAVLREVIRMESTNSSNCLLAAKLCYEHLNQPDEGLLVVLVLFGLICFSRGLINLLNLSEIFLYGLLVYYVNFVWLLV